MIDKYTDEELERTVREASFRAFETVEDSDTYQDMHCDAYGNEIRHELGEDYDEMFESERLLEHELNYLPVVLTVLENELRKRQSIHIWFGYLPTCAKCGTNGDHYCPADVAVD